MTNRYTLILAIFASAASAALAQEGGSGTEVDRAFAAGVESQSVLPNGWRVTYRGLFDGVATFDASLSDSAAGCCDEKARGAKPERLLHQMICTTPELAAYLARGGHYRFYIVKHLRETGEQVFATPAMSDCSTQPVEPVFIPPPPRLGCDEERSDADGTRARFKAAALTC